MSATSSHGKDGRGRNQPAPLRRPTRSESAQARKQLKGWRARKLGGSRRHAVVLIAVVGWPWAAPHHHKNGALPACVPAAGTTTGASLRRRAPRRARRGGNGAANVQTVNGASNHMLSYRNHYTQTAPQRGATTERAAGAANTTAAAGAEPTTTTAAAGAGTTPLPPPRARPRPPQPPPHDYRRGLRIDHRGRDDHRCRRGDAGTRTAP